MGRRLLLSCVAICLLSGQPLPSQAMYPGLGKLQIAPIPYDLPTPQYPGRIQITPTRPNPPIIPSVIFRPPSEIVRNFGELKAEASALQSPPSSLNVEADAPVSEHFVSPLAPRISPSAHESSQGGPQEQSDPLLRPTRRQALGW